MKNNFKDYGFEADFEGEILKQIGDILYGVVYVEYFGRSVVCEWNTKGKVISKYKIDEKAFELKPIKKEWYENPDNFPCLIKKNDWFMSVDNNEDYQYYIMDGYTLATKEEVLALLVNVLKKGSF